MAAEQRRRAEFEIGDALNLPPGLALARPFRAAQSGLATRTAFSTVALGCQDQGWTRRFPAIETWRCILADAMAATGPRNQFQSQMAARIAPATASASKTPAIHASGGGAALGLGRRGAASSELAAFGEVLVSVVKRIDSAAPRRLTHERRVRRR